MNRRKGKEDGKRKDKSETKRKRGKDTFSVDEVARIFNVPRHMIPGYESRILKRTIREKKRA